MKKSISRLFEVIVVTKLPTQVRAEVTTEVMSVRIVPNQLTPFYRIILRMRPIPNPTKLTMKKIMSKGVLVIVDTKLPTQVRAEVTTELISARIASREPTAGVIL